MNLLCRLVQSASLSLCLAFSRGQAVYSAPSLTLTATAIARNLNLDGRGDSRTYIVKVADITLSTDNAAGLSLFANAGNLAKSGGSSIAYKVTTVEEGAPPPTYSDFSSGDYTLSTSTSGAANKQVYIKYTPAPLQDPGTYSAVISLIVTDN